MLEDKDGENECIGNQRECLHFEAIKFYYL